MGGKARGLRYFGKVIGRLEHFKSFEDWEKMQKDEPTEILTALQKTISKELRRRKAEEKQTKQFEKWAAAHGYELTKKKESPGKPEEKKPEAAAPFKL
jgi:hypothetical protein